MLTKLPKHKTKIVATVGPVSRSPEMLKKLILAGMNIARLNFSHGDHKQHLEDIKNIRLVSEELGVPVAILGDLPGPKIRIGTIAGGSVQLEKGSQIILTNREIEGNEQEIPVQFKEFIKSVKKSDTIFLNDGFIQLKVLKIDDIDAVCEVIIGGPLLSNKGLNLPDASLSVDAITSRDLEHLEFGLKAGVDAFGISFVHDEKDIRKVKRFARKKGYEAFVVAKIERKEALANIDAILEATDAIMIARGDLGVELPIEQVPCIQKDIIFKANLAHCPVITATQMLESMTDNIRPTRAEVTDVANAILDGTDAVMLSEETAIGKYPQIAVGMLASIARETDAERHTSVNAAGLRYSIKKRISSAGTSSEDVLSLDVAEAINTLPVRFVLAPTHSGGTPRRISRYKSDTWIVAFCSRRDTRNQLLFSYGVWPLCVEDTDDDAVLSFVKKNAKIKHGERVIIARRDPDDSFGKTNSLKIITLA